MGLGRPAWLIPSPSRVLLSHADSSHLLEFMSFTIAPLLTLLSWRYLRGKDWIGNPSLNLHLLCLISKYLDLIFVGLGPLGSLGGWICMNGLRINMGFGPSFGLWPSSFSVLALDHGPRHFMLQNRPKPAKKSSSKIYVQT